MPLVLDSIGRLRNAIISKTDGYPLQCASIVRMYPTSTATTSSDIFVSQPACAHNNLMGGTGLWLRDFQYVVHNKPNGELQGYYTDSGSSSDIVSYRDSNTLYIQPIGRLARLLHFEPDWSYYGEWSSMHSTYLNTPYFYLGNGSVNNTRGPNQYEQSTNFSLFAIDGEDNLDFERITCTANYLFFIECNSSFSFNQGNVSIHTYLETAFDEYNRSVYVDELFDDNNIMHYYNIKVSPYGELPWDNSKSGYLVSVAGESIFMNASSQCPNSIEIPCPALKMKWSNAVTSVIFYGKSVNFEGAIANV